MSKYRRIKYEDRCQIYALSKRGSSQERSPKFWASGKARMRPLEISFKPAIVVSAAKKILAFKAWAMS